MKAHGGVMLSCTLVGIVKSASLCPEAGEAPTLSVFPLFDRDGHDTSRLLGEGDTFIFLLPTGLDVFRGVEDSIPLTIVIGQPPLSSHRALEVRPKLRFTSPSDLLTGKERLFPCLRQDRHSEE